MGVRKGRHGSWPGLGLLATALLAVAAPARAATFRIAVGIDPDTMDPVQMTTTTVGNLVDYAVETLTAIDETGKILPRLAESWTVSPDGRQYTLKLRAGVRFHDGSLLDATAVKWNLDRLTDPAVRVPVRASYPLERTDVVDPLTVRVTLKHPYAPFIGALSWTTSGLLSPASATALGNDYKNYGTIVGTGPYTLAGRRKGESITFARNPAYWGRPPSYDSVVVRIVPEAATRESLLLAGQVDLVVLPPVADVPALQRNPTVKVLLAPSDRTMFVAINTRKPPLSDRRVRQALNYAVDKAAILKHVLFGVGDPMDAPMAPSLLGYCRTGAYPYDPARAKALLAEAGIQPGMRLQLLHPTGRYVQDREAAAAIAGYLREVGLAVDPQTMDWPSYVATISTPAERNITQLHFLGWAPPFLDASQQVLQFLSTFAPPAGLETSFYANAEVDKLILAAERELNPDRRRSLYCEVSKRVWEDAPWVFLWVQRFPIVYSAKVANVSSLPNEKFDAVYAYPVP
jgi:peptide/nickel transport system substrate-binding protein